MINTKGMINIRKQRLPANMVAKETGEPSFLLEKERIGKEKRRD